MIEPIMHTQVRCPRCAARGMRELTSLPEEGHPIFMCPFCRHTWCEQGRIRRPGAAALRSAGTQPEPFSVRAQEVRG